MNERACEVGASFGQWIAIRRKALRLSRGELARKISCAVITIRKIEDDTRRPSAQLAELLAEQLAVLPKERCTFAQVARGECPITILSAPDVINATHWITLHQAGTGHHQRDSHLPRPATPLLGRAEQLEATLALFEQPEVRLITFIGTAGIGKTRLALQVAIEAEQRSPFADGVYFVSLASIEQAERAPVAIAQALGIAPSPGQSATDDVQHYLRDKCILLVLDNFEQILDAATTLATWLAYLPQLKLLVTSRAPLRLTSEYLFEVPPLALPPMPPPSQIRSEVPPRNINLTDYTATALFLQRVRMVWQDFAFTSQEEIAIAALCRRLNGLPLAIELAAAKVRLLSPAKMLAGLSLNQSAGALPMLDLLSEGPRDLPPRQRTVRNTIAWSYSLLTQSQQRLLRSLSVFSGGFTLEAASNVAGDESTFAVDLQALFDNSLVHRSVLSESSEGEHRFLLLEMIREYAREQLIEHHESFAVHQRHLDYYLTLLNSDPAQDIGEGERVERWPGVISRYRYPHFTMGVAWMRRLIPDGDNLLAALTWSLKERHNIDLGIHLVTSLFNVWEKIAAGDTPIEWIKVALAHTKTDAYLQVRGRLLCEWAFLAHRRGSLAQAAQLAEESLLIHRTLEDELDLICTAMCLSEIYMDLGHYSKATALTAEYEDISQRLKKKRYVGWARYIHGKIALLKGDVARALQGCQECIEIINLPDERDVIAVIYALGELACLQDRFDEAVFHLEKTLHWWRDHQAPALVAQAIHALGDVALFRGDLLQAKALFEESLMLHQEYGGKPAIVANLAALAALSALEGRAHRADLLWRSAEAARITLGVPRPTLRYGDYHTHVEVSLAHSEPESASHLIKTKALATMTLDQAVTFALQDQT